MTDADEGSMNDLIRAGLEAGRSEVLLARIFGTDPEPHAGAINEEPNTNAPEEAQEENP